MESIELIKRTFKTFQPNNLGLIRPLADKLFKCLKRLEPLELLEPLEPVKLS
jgi:hypothetical protein